MGNHWSGFFTYALGKSIFPIQHARERAQRRCECDMKQNICLALVLLGFAVVGLSGCASDDVVTTTTETTETQVSTPSVTTETQTVRY